MGLDEEHVGCVSATGFARAIKLWETIIQRADRVFNVVARYYGRGCAFFGLQKR